MFLLGKLLIGAVMIAITVIIHAVVCDIVLQFIDSHHRRIILRGRKYWKILALIASVFMICTALMVDIWLWTVLFFFVEYDVFQTFEDCLYFTSVSFTTVGFGDIVLPPEWRILSASAAVNGSILFGWSAAFIFEIMAKLYKGDRRYRGDIHDE